MTDQEITEDFIVDVLRSTDIMELIAEYIPLEKCGDVAIATCPFHDDQGKSLTVNGKDQFYDCPVCEAHGSAIGFLMQFKGIGFDKAMHELAQAAGK